MTYRILLFLFHHRFNKTESVVKKSKEEQKVIDEGLIVAQNLADVVIRILVYGVGSVKVIFSVNLMVTSISNEDKEALLIISIVFHGVLICSPLF